ncbi:Cysteine Protease Atg4B [Manis pentadactyla]|nr:Cysteine Protease Atg4B [Manis pentadactyla]
MLFEKEAPFEDCAAVPWQQGQRDQSLQNDLSHHPPGVELRSRGLPAEDAKGNRLPEALVPETEPSHLACPPALPMARVWEDITRQELVPATLLP